jgi:hypothetical protein
MGSDDGDAARGPDEHYTFDVFGLKLEVSNPRLAELLAMDAREALTTDVKDLAGSRAARDFREEAAQAVPDVVINPPSPADDVDAAARREFRSRTAAIGSALGFDAGPDGLWRSPTGLAILTRSFERPVSLSAASHYVAEIAIRREQLGGPDSSVLFVVDGQRSVDVFKVAVRQQRLYHHLRVAAMTNLDEIRALMETGAIDHMKAVILLSPFANVDVGEILSVLHAGDSSPDTASPDDPPVASEAADR